MSVNAQRDRSNGGEYRDEIALLSNSLTSKVNRCALFLSRLDVRHDSLEKCHKVI